MALAKPGRFYTIRTPSLWTQEDPPQPQMANPIREHFQFYRQFRRRYHTTGAIAPSSRFLAKAVAAPMRQRDKPARILEVGPGTGALTRQIVRSLRSGDHLDLVEMNEVFAEMLEKRFNDDPAFRKFRDQCSIHVCRLQDFHPELRYDYIVSGLPLNNFSAEVVAEIYEKFASLLTPGGVLSYFEYMGMRSFRGLVCRAEQKTRLQALEEVIGSYLLRYRIRRDSVFVNLPPAFVQHLQFPGRAV